MCRFAVYNIVSNESGIGMGHNSKNKKKFEL